MYFHQESEVSCFEGIFTLCLACNQQLNNSDNGDTHQKMYMSSICLNILLPLWIWKQCCICTSDVEPLESVLLFCTHAIFWKSIQVFECLYEGVLVLCWSWFCTSVLNHIHLLLKPLTLEITFWILMWCFVATIL